jgi:hypothetical protein
MLIKISSFGTKRVKQTITGVYILGKPLNVVAVVDHLAGGEVQSSVNLFDPVLPMW